MTNSLHINSFGYLNKVAFGSRMRGKKPWLPSQSGPCDVTRDQVLAVPYPTFGKLQLPERLAFASAALALESQTIESEKTGICLAIPFGSLSTDLLYTQSVRNGFPSPALFSATLPSSPIADVAIFFGIKGPTVAFAGGDNPCITAFDLASWQVASGEVDTMLFLAVWAPVEPADHGAIALLLGSDEEGGTRVCLSSASEWSNCDPPRPVDERQFFSQLVEGIEHTESRRIWFPGKRMGYISIE